MNIQQNIRDLRSTLPENVRLVAVSKFHPIEALASAYDAGQRIFGESKVQELSLKYEQLPKDIEWHFIGHLQTNKVKYLAPYVALIHGVDTYKLLSEISRQGERVGRRIPCLLQLHVAQEETKFGFLPCECDSMLESGEWRQLNGIELRGIMGMASNTDNEGQIRNEFSQLRKYFYKVKEKYFPNDSNFCELSMGMSDDYPIAIEEGSTIVRVGSRIFGNRNY